ncbi:MAG TPA: hypothetical protein VEB21_19305 [Terriglobales bacterium]|nr:hypothetical protein [Terriglobales bacterium]
MRIIPLTRLPFFALLAALLLGGAAAASAQGFKVDNFDDDSAGWSLIIDATTDSDGDGATDEEEGDDDRDNDGIPNDEDYDPTGYFYDINTGRILPGGSVTITGCPNMVLEDGSQGFYQFLGLDIGTCTINITPPPGYELATLLCPNLDPPPLDVPDGPGAPLVLGNTEVGNTGFLSGSDCTPYYFTLNFNSLTDIDVFANNFPFLRVDAAVAPAASTVGLAMMVGLLLLAGTWRMATPRRVKSGS